MPSSRAQLARAADTRRVGVLIGTAWVYLIAAELIASNAGLGYRINVASRNLNVAQIFFYIGIIVLLAFLMFIAFGFLCVHVLGHFTPRQQGTFWTIYFMLFYALAGLWFGRAFIVIAAAITVLTLIGYFFVTGETFLPWMAVVNGGGLIVGGLWMRRS